MNKLIVFPLLLFSISVYSQNEIPAINWNVLNYIDSLRINNIYGIPNVVEKALVHANAESPDGFSFGTEYSDLHKLLPGDIYFINNYYEFEELPENTRNQQRRDEYDIHKVAIITLEQYKLVRVMLNSPQQKEEKEILMMLFGIKDFDNDKLHFYHPKSLF